MNRKTMQSPKLHFKKCDRYCSTLWENDNTPKCETRNGCSWIMSAENSNWGKWRCKDAESDFDEANAANSIPSNWKKWSLPMMMKNRKETVGRRTRLLPDKCQTCTRLSELWLSQAASSHTQIAKSMLDKSRNLSIKIALNALQYFVCQCSHALSL